MKPKVGIVGLGKLGLPIACAMAKRGFNVTGIEKSRDRRIQIQNCDSSIVEPEVLKLLHQFHDYPGSFTLGTCLPCAIHFAETLFIMLPTPSETSGAFSGKLLFQISDHIGKILGALKEEKYLLIVILSTVMPGTMNKIKRIIETTSKKKCGKDFDLCYSPELVAIGSIIETYLNPDFVIIGESSPEAGKRLEELYKQLFLNNPSIVHMNYTNAEICKISLNAYITTKISFANTLAEICERVPGANVDTITSTIGQDSRIGTRFFKGALGYGGFCFYRDPRAFLAIASDVNIHAPISKATDIVNDRQPERIVTWVKNILPKNGRVGILGIAFKPDTNTTEESQGLKIAQKIADDGIMVRIFDPLKPENLNEILEKNQNIKWEFTIDNFLKHSNVVVIVNPCKEFQDLEPEDFKENSKVIDCWRILDKTKFQNQRRVKYFAVGVCYDQ